MQAENARSEFNRRIYQAPNCTEILRAMWSSRSGTAMNSVVLGTEEVHDFQKS